jgi:hypothetical protein
MIMIPRTSNSSRNSTNTNSKNGKRRINVSTLPEKVMGENQKDSEVASDTPTELHWNHPENNLEQGEEVVEKEGLASSVVDERKETEIAVPSAGVDTPDVNTTTLPTPPNLNDNGTKEEEICPPPSKPSAPPSEELKALQIKLVKAQEKLTNSRNYWQSLKDRQQAEDNMDRILSFSSHSGDDIPHQMAIVDMEIRRESRQVEHLKAAIERLLSQ